MPETVRKLVNIKLNRLEETERKLAHWAAKGLLLEEAGPMFWRFRKSNPQKLKYTITFFQEGSMYNPGFTDNQHTYFDYAKAAGWRFVTQNNQMQIFVTQSNNPVPFESDEKQKFENIKRSMKRILLPRLFNALVVIFILVLSFQSLRQDPINFLSDTTRLLLQLLLILLVINEIYGIIDNFIWVRRSEKTIANGGDYIKKRSSIHAVIEQVLMALSIFIGSLVLINLFTKIGELRFMIIILQLPILMTIFYKSIQYFKKRQLPANKTKALSLAVIVIAFVVYDLFLYSSLLPSGFMQSNHSNYRVLDWKVSPTESHAFTIYADEIPLKSEDLYGAIDYDYYSYEKREDRSVFLTKRSYRQDSLPAENSPPQIQYEILEPHYNFVYRMVKEHLLKIPKWYEEETYKLIDHKKFNAQQAYQRLYKENGTGEYILFFNDKIIVLKMEQLLTPNQLSVVKEKLGL